MWARRALTAAAVAATTMLLAGDAPGLGQSGDGGATAAQDLPRKSRVLVKDNYFEPRSAEIVEGGHVVWKWRGENRHNVRFTKVPKGAARKGAKTRSEGQWKRAFFKPGVYRYVCRLWSGMRGSVTVRPEPEPPPPS
jgi:plastocyanin